MLPATQSLVHLRYHTIRDKWQVYNEVTGELKFVGATNDLLWEGPIADDDAPDDFYVQKRSDDEEVVWINDCFQFDVFKTDDVYVVYDNGKSEEMSLAAFRTAFQRETFEIPLADGGKLELGLAVHDRPWSGASYFWNLSDIWDSLVKTGGWTNHSRWSESWWPHWEKRRVAIRLPPTYLRRASRVGQSNVEAFVPASELDVDDRFYEKK